MAIYERGILGVVRGKVGNIQGVKRRVNNILQKKGKGTSQNPSTSQQLNQDKMFNCRDFGSFILADQIKLLFKANISKSTIWAEWVKSNYSAFDSLGIRDITKVIIGNGSLLVSLLSSVTIQVASSRARIRWNKNWASGNPVENNTVYSTAINLRTGELRYTTGAAIRKERKDYVVFDDITNSDTILAWLTFYDAINLISSQTSSNQAN